MRGSLITFLLIGVALPRARAQSTTAEQFNAWTAFSANIQVGERWWLIQETFWRRNNGFENPMQFKAGVSVERRIGPWGLSLGYAYWLNYPYGEFPSLHTQPEHRVWQQVTFKHATGSVRWNHRLRAEQRFIERFHADSEGIVSDGFHYLGRVRYQLQQAIPLCHAQEKGEWALIPFQEVIVRFGDERTNGVFDQFRLGLLGAWRMSTACQLRAGYMFQYLVKPDNVRVEHNHTLVLNVNLDLPHRALQAPASK